MRNTDLERTDSRPRQADNDCSRPLDAAIDVVWRTDLCATVTLIGRTSDVHLGAPPERYVGRCFAEFIDESSLEMVTADFQHVRDGGEVVSREACARDASGSRRVISYSAQPLLDPLGRVSGIQGILRDVTPARGAEEERARRFAE
ncbi:MAG: PAS domain-containing protein [Thermoanaerobaculia bacterium]